MAFALISLSTWQPRYTASFVSMAGHTLNKNVVVFDARADRSLAGYSFIDMIDTLPASPFAISKGVPQGSDFVSSDVSDEKTFWCFRIDVDGTFLAQESGYPGVDVQGSKNRIVRIAYRGRRPRVLGAAKATFDARPRTPFTQSRDLNGISAWGLPYVRTHSPAGYEDRANRAVFGDVGNFTFYPITPGYDTCMHDAESTVAVVRQGSRYVPLEGRNVGKTKYVLDDIVWVSREGWLVVRGGRNEQDGFVWLFPRRS